MRTISKKARYALRRRCIRYVVVFLLVIPGLCTGPLGLASAPEEPGASRLSGAGRLESPTEKRTPQWYGRELPG